MATKTRKIPQNHWDRHKETILNLFLTSDLSVDELAQTMDRDHGFFATVSQYEAQFRAWNARKNLKVHEWEGIFEIIDRLSSQDIQSRVVISGHPVAMNRIHRARRHCNRETRLRKRRRVETDLSNVSDVHKTSDAFIEVQNSSGEWRQYTSSTHNTSSDRVVEPVAQELIVDHEVNQARPVYDNDLDHQHPQNLPGGSPWSFSFHTPEFISNEGENPAYPTDPSISGPEPQVAQALIQYEFNEDIISPGVEMVTSPWRLDSLGQFSLGTLCINDLPFERFERGSALERLIPALHPSPWQDSALLSGIQTLVTKFVVEVATAMSETNEKPPTQNVNKVWFTLERLKSILPRTRQGSGHSSLARPSHEMFDVELHRILLFSISNGFAGLDEIPLKLVFRFLDQHSNVSSLLSRWFQGIPNHFAKGLAEKLFQVAIEAGNHQATRFFLQKGLADVDNTFCFVDGQKYTPLERASKLGELKVIHELLRFKPDVNQTFFNIYDKDDFDCGRALGCLIYEPKYMILGPGGCFIEHRNDRVFLPEYMETVDALIDAGIKVSPFLVHISLERYVKMDLAKKLISKLIPSDYSEVISRGILSIIIRKIPAGDALETVSNIISSYEETRYKKCLSHQDEVNWAIMTAAKQGNFQLVQQFFQHAKSSTQILSAAIRGGNQELIEFILAQKPAIRQTPAELIKKPDDLNDPCFSDYTTPLAEAIDGGDELLVKRLENEGALEHLDNVIASYTDIPSRLDTAICAASKVGNIAYIRKLLRITTNINEEAAINALSEAAKNRREDIIRLLLDSGVYIKNDGSFAYFKFMAELYKWNMPLLFDVILTFPSFRSTYSHAKLDQGSEFLEILDFLFQHNLIPSFDLMDGLCLAVSQSRNSILRHIPRLGLNITNPSALLDAAKGQPIMLRTLLAYVPSTQEGILGFGTSCVVDAIRRSDLESLDILLACKAIDFKQALFHDHTPLAVAIEADAASCCSQFTFTARLLDAGCDPNELVASYFIRSERSFNITPLIRAIKAGNKNLVQFLLDRGADVNKAATHGVKQTPLQAAAKCADLDMTELLLRNGADVNGKPSTCGGGTALQFAAISGNCNIAALLIDRGANMCDAPSTFDGRWPLEGAAEHGRIDMIQFLWNVSLGGFPIEQCRKAIDLAEKNGHRACRDLVRELAASSGIMLTLEN
ncbi:uncharacterized protein F4817DRAFT_334451 [Daldinia loculata]|uniref:uncharacterized protein n=1 Tax=Daldinia loculata TaxID=103429 RepID=UPI0020C4C60B|nr:uncharacterized protein F4817DRAFT_334451 [Daldinia loculata]KAI1648270.1 hypothetical protein F4817DRAFT_334451 [Daldinia loculata]